MIFVMLTSLCPIIMLSTAVTVSLYSDFGCNWKMFVYSTPYSEEKIVGLKFAETVVSWVIGVAVGAIFLAAFAAVIIYTLYGSTDTFFGKLEKLINSQNSTLMLSFNALFPYTACILYLLSYKISCKLYLKGAETHG
jgi:hypothetical protein